MFSLSKKGVTGLIDLFGLDASQAAEVFGEAASLLAGAADELFFDEDGFGLPGSEVLRERWTEKSDDGSCCGRCDVHRAAVRPDKERRSTDDLPEFDQVGLAYKGEKGRLGFLRDFSLPLLIFRRADEDDSDSGRAGQHVRQLDEIFCAPIAELIPGADMEDDDLAPLKMVFGPESLDFFLLLFPCLRKKERRKRIAEGDAQSLDQIKMVFHAVEIPVFAASGNPDVVDKAFVFQVVTGFEFCARKKGKEGGPRPSVEIDNCIILFCADPAGKPEKIHKILAGRERDDIVQIGVALDKPEAGLLDDIRERNLREGLFKGGDSRRGHHDVADAP